MPSTPSEIWRREFPEPRQHKWLLPSSGGRRGRLVVLAVFVIGLLTALVLGNHGF